MSAPGPHAALLRDPGHFIALGGGAGLVPRAPGTAGTIVGMALYTLIDDLDRLVYGLLVAACFAIGIAVCGRAAGRLGRHDHPAIVWDECTGILATMAVASGGIVDMIAGFCAFRLFDVLKPWPISAIDARVRGGTGIMLDDLAAAVYAGGSMEVFKYLSYSYN